jgi:ribonucleases P/MRP protein subunit RPP40
MHARLASQLNSHISIEAVYIDFSRALDSIVVSKLLFKLECYGVSGLLLEWISCFLYGRTQRVVVGGCGSSLVSDVSGVPQGSVLGPVYCFLCS